MDFYHAWPGWKRLSRRTIFRELVPFKKIVHEHFEPNFTAIIEFESQGENTLINWYKLYETKALFDLAEKRYGTVEGFKQTIERLRAYLNQAPDQVL